MTETQTVSPCLDKIHLPGASSCLRHFTTTWPPQRFQERLFFSFAPIVPAQLLKSRRSKTQRREQK